MRGNDSAAVTFHGFLPAANRLTGPEAPLAKRMALLLPVVLGTYAAAYLGIAAGAYEEAARCAAEVAPNGSRLADTETNQRRLAEMKVLVESARALVYAAASAFDAGTAPSLSPYYEAKVAADRAAVGVTAEAMTLGGGTAFARRTALDRYFRDARASMVMGVPDDAALLAIARIQFPK
jgi:alkylation response protein AidB-like acyl-CoA dehydrogenase